MTAGPRGHLLLGTRRLVGTWGKDRVGFKRSSAGRVDRALHRHWKTRTNRCRALSPSRSGRLSSLPPGISGTAWGVLQVVPGQGPSCRSCLAGLVWPGWLACLPGIFLLRHPPEGGRSTNPKLARKTDEVQHCYSVAPHCFTDLVQLQLAHPSGSNVYCRWHSWLSWPSWPSG